MTRNMLTYILTFYSTNILFVILYPYCTSERIRYISTEHPMILYEDTELISINLTSQRYGRTNPFYYVGVHFNTSKWIDNNVSLDFYFYEYLSNVYKRGFIEMHFKLCDLIHKDKFFGAAMKQGKLSQPCPYPPGEYNLYNMTINHLSIPRSFPFNKGRIYCNVSYFKRLAAAGYIDMELKEVNINQYKKGSKLHL